MIELNDSFSLSNLVEINANHLWDNSRHVNVNFCRQHYRAAAMDESMFLMDGTNYPQKLLDAEAYGCTPEFIEAYRVAIEDYKADLVMFLHCV